MNRSFFTTFLGGPNYKGAVDIKSYAIIATPKQDHLKLFEHLALPIKDLPNTNSEENPDSFGSEHGVTLPMVAGGKRTRLLQYNEIIGQTYRLESLIGKGGMAFVFKAVHTTLGSHYAIKVLATEDLSQIARQRFEAEARAIAYMNHPNIVKVHNMGLDGGDTPFYVMDLLEGEPLSDFIDKNDIDFDTALEILRQTAIGLAYAHSKGIIHRDVKPSNIFLVKQSNDHNFVKIVDFGIAKITSDSAVASSGYSAQSRTAAGEIMGSPYYMSPEQTLGQNIDARSDIYSLGCTYYELLTGKPPYTGKTAFETMLMHQEAPPPAVQDEEGQELLRRMMAKKPSERYQSLTELLNDIDRIKAGKPIGRMSTAEGAWPGQNDIGSGQDTEGLRLGDNKALASAIVLVVSLIVIGFAFLLLTRPAQTIANLPETKAVELDPRDALKEALGATEAKPLNAHAPIFSEVTNVNGKKMRRFNIGPEFIGEVIRLWQLDGAFTEKPQAYQAKDILTLPEDRFYTLSIDLTRHPELINNLSAFEAIKKDEFAGVVIVGNVYAGFEENSHANIANKRFTKALLKIVAGWTNLRFVTLDRAYLEDDDLDNLDRCKGLQVLDIIGPQEVSKKIDGHKAFQNLIVLNLGQIDPRPFFASIKKAQKLYTFGLYKTDPDADLSKLSLPKCVVRVSLTNIDFNQKILDLVEPLPKLDSMTLFDCNVDPSCIKKVLAKKSVSSMQIQDATIAKLKAAGVVSPKIVRGSDTGIVLK
jgi:serine/threonine protein kinase